MSSDDSSWLWTLPEPVRVAIKGKAELQRAHLIREVLRDGAASLALTITSRHSLAERFADFVHGCLPAAPSGKTGVVGWIRKGFRTRS